MENPYEFLLSLGLGVALASACGFRVFLPALVVAIAHRSGHVEIPEHFYWISSNVSIFCLATAATLEILAYFVPILDNLLDTIATPAAAVAGSVMTSGVLSDISPWLHWTLAIIAGGGTSTIVQSSTVALRASSSALTAGTANPIIAAGETLGAILMTLLSIILLPLGIVIAIILLVIGIRSLIRYILPKVT